MYKLYMGILFDDEEIDEDVDEDKRDTLRKATGAATASIAVGTAGCMGGKAKDSEDDSEPDYTSNINNVVENIEINEQSEYKEIIVKTSGPVIINDTNDRHEDFKADKLYIQVGKSSNRETISEAISYLDGSNIHRLRINRNYEDITESDFSDNTFVLTFSVDSMHSGRTTADMNGYVSQKIMYKNNSIQLSSKRPEVVRTD